MTKEDLMLRLQAAQDEWRSAKEQLEVATAEAIIRGWGDTPGPEPDCVIKAHAYLATKEERERAMVATRNLDALYNLVTDAQVRIADASEKPWSDSAFGKGE